MLMNGLDVTDEIRTPDISQKASLVSAQPVVRQMLLDMQRDVAKENNVIMDGRDIGTVVLPQADVKIFLTASAEVRAQRRHAELMAKGAKDTLVQVLADIKQRDHQDSTRAIAPLKQAADAILVDTSELDIDGAVAAIRQIVLDKVGA
jgi:cytidylate kinase